MNQVLSVYLVNWVVAGAFIEDTQYYDTIWFVMVDLNDGRTLCHEHSFVDEGRLSEGREAAERFARRVEERGVINEDHWYFHEFFSATLPQRLNTEAYHENLHRTNRASESNSAYYSSGHA